MPSCGPAELCPASQTSFEPLYSRVVNRHIRNVLVLLLAAYPAVALAADNSYLTNLPTGARWLEHLNNDLLPFWTMPSALGNPLGSFPSTRCDDGSLLDFNKPCAPIAGNAYLMTPDQYLVPLSRQTYGYGVPTNLPATQRISTI